jgi:hypothetical protein
MAYPVVSAPYGFKPVNLLGGQVFAGSTRQYPVAYNNTTALNYGDLVQLSSGSIVISTLTYNSTTGLGTVGVFLGCSYTSPITGQKIFANSLPANTLANDIVAYVEDDPDAVFKAVVVAYSTTTSTTPLPVSQTYVGTNAFVNSTNTPTASGIYPAIGQSAMALQVASTNIRVTATAPFRIVGLVSETAVTVALTGTTSSGTLTVTSGNAASLSVGMQVFGTGIYQGSYNYITAISGTSVTLANNVTTNQSTSASFTAIGYPEVLVKWNFGYHSYYAATGV